MKALNNSGEAPVSQCLPWVAAFLPVAVRAHNLSTRDWSKVGVAAGWSKFRRSVCVARTSFNSNAQSQHPIATIPCQSTKCTPSVQMKDASWFNQLATPEVQVPGADGPYGFSSWLSGEWGCVGFLDGNDPAQREIADNPPNLRGDLF